MIFIETSSGECLYYRFVETVELRLFTYHMHELLGKVLGAKIGFVGQFGSYPLRGCAVEYRVEALCEHAKTVELRLAEHAGVGS